MKAALLALVVTSTLGGWSRPAQATTLSNLVGRCAPHVAQRTALAIISVESGGRWWAVNDNDLPTPALRSPAEAIAYARRRVAQGGSIDLGIAQLNSAHLNAMHLTVDEAFEPCTNIAMGMSVLQAAWSQSARRWGLTRYALFRALEAYNGGPGAWTSHDAKLRARVQGYATAVWTRAEHLPIAGPPAPGGPVSPPPVVAAHAQRTTRIRTRAPQRGVRVFYQEGQ